ncbi:MAG: hypothetical protein LBT94_02975 [Prevotellaceae bacterium]|jgi:uncharacterized protein YdiU (UPF0061 family)|nr:hypothetical protein [Prevotellaceae bacterium]
MMRFFFSALFGILLAATLASCKHIDKYRGGQPSLLAVAGDKKLYVEDIKAMFPPNITQADSLTMLHSYVDAWVKKELLLRLAEDNLSSKQKNVSALLEDYRTSLLVYRYKQEYIERVDTLVSEAECEAFYNDNRQHLTLHKPVVRALFIKLRKNSQHLERIRKLYTSTRPEDITALEDLCLQAALKFDHYGNRWLTLDELTKDLPPQRGYEERAARKRTIEVEDEEYAYLVAIHDFKERNTTAPLEYEYDNIKTIILNQRKKGMIQSLEQRILQEAVQKNVVKIYVEN